MDRLLARRLERDEEFQKKIVRLAQDYLKLGKDALSYWSAEFDTAYDLMMCYAPLTKADLDSLERGSPKRFILPMTATQITTMTTYVSQVLFGQESPNKVEGRRPEDEIRAELVNQLLRWNAEQQPTYLLGYLWVQDAIAVNRGVFYNSWQPIFRPEIVTEDVADPEDLDEMGQPRTFQRTRRANKEVGGYCKMELVSPYDFVCDPALPLWRLNEMRFAGHRTTIPVAELERRSKLSPDHPAYVMPWAVKKVKEKAKKGATQNDLLGTSVGGSVTNPSETRLSRTAYERTRGQQPTGQGNANKSDPGNAECWELWVRLNPSENEIYEGDAPDDPVVFQVLVSADTVLSMNESTYAHGMYPYSVGEARPSGHFQFSPGWVTMLKGIQDHVDWLKNRHQEALSRTVGNIFVYDPSRVDVSDFMNPDKEGLLISLKPEAFGQRIGDVFQQVPIKDLTENFQAEAMEFVRLAESVTAANSSMQGAFNAGDPSATQYAGTQQMSAGRMTSVARLLSVQGLVPQTKQFVANFQQYMEHEQEVRFKSDRTVDLPPELANAYSVKLSRDLLAGDYEYIAHDGTLPGTDARKVAAITRLLEAAATFPQVFTPAPGNLDPRLLIFAGAKASGINVENFTYSPQQLAEQAAAAGGPPLPPEAGLPPEMGLPPGMPPEVLPPEQAPGPKPMEPTLPDLGPVALPAVDAPQVRPANA